MNAVSGGKRRSLFMALLTIIFVLLFWTLSSYAAQGRVLWESRRWLNTTPWAENHTAYMDPGTYDGCHRHEPITWILLVGHHRTMNWHLPYFREFLRPHRCRFVVESTADVLEHNTGANWYRRKVDMSRTPSLANVLAFSAFVGGNIAVDVTNAPKGPHWGWMRMHRFFRWVAGYHGIPFDESDMVIVTRPDMLTSHAVQPSRLQQAIYVMRHDRYIKAWDPSELLVVAARGVYERVLTWDGKWQPWHCGHPWPRVLIHQPSDAGIPVYFISTRLKVHIHRVDGSYGIAVNRPSAPTNVNPRATSLRVLNISEDALRVLGGRRVCNRSNTPPDEYSPRPLFINGIVWAAVNETGQG